MLKVIERDQNIWQNLSEDIRKDILRYRGFDGINLRTSEDVNNIPELLKDTNLKREDVELILIESVTLPPSTETRFRFLGFDVGIIKEYDEYVFFSGILNEIHLKGNPGLESLVQKLNKNYLFDSQEDCNEYLTLRDQALDMGNANFLETAYETNQFQCCRIYVYEAKG